MLRSINNKLFIAIAITLLSFTSHAQSIIDEDMLELIEANAKPLWAEAAPAFTTNSIPDKYKDESAIIIGYKRNVSIDKKTRSGFLTRGERSLLFFENIRFKIKLNDKSAVTNFTEVYFRYSDKQDGFSAKVVKSDGTSINVSLDDAVTVENTNDVPEFYKSFFDQETSSQRRYFKVAIPDLEPNDILEYVSLTKSKLDVAYSGYIEFSPQYEVCSKNYPVLFNQIGIETDDKSFFKSMALNGAPAFKKEASSDPEFFRYVFTDIDRPTEKDVNFVSAYKAFPLNKFQVIYANKASKVKGALIGQVGEIKSSFTKEELCLKAWEDYENMSDYSYSGAYTVQMFVNGVWAELKKLGAKKWEDKEYIEKVYYRLRAIICYRDNYMSDKMFAYVFGSLLFQKDIKSDLLISVSNNMGTMKDVLFDQEIKYATRVNGLIYYNATDFSNPDESVESFLGNTGFVIEKPNKKGEQVITEVNFPDASFADNNADFVFTSSLNADMNTLSVSRTSTYKGISKAKNISDALKYTLYTLNDYKYYGGEDPTDKMKSREEEEYYKSLNAIKESYKESKPIFSKNQLQNEFSNTVKFKTFTLASDGRSKTNKNLSFTEDFELSGMVRKAGKKFLVNVAGLVGSQLQIKKEERVRSHDINVGNARSLFWTINFKIPDGYTAEGLKELTTEVTNETGTFASVAEQKDNMVVIKIKKIYKKANFSKDRWQEMLGFVDAAFNNSYKYILLKPKA
jgi:hypothetical protein